MRGQDPSVRGFLLHNLIAPAKGEPMKFRIPVAKIANAIDGIGEFPHTPGQEQWRGPVLFVKGAKSKCVTFFCSSGVIVQNTCSYVQILEPTKYTCCGAVLSEHEVGNSRYGSLGYVSAVASTA